MRRLLLPLQTILNPQLFNLIYTLPLKVSVGIFAFYLFISAAIVATYYNLTIFPQALTDIAEVINSTLQNLPENVVLTIQDNTLTTKNITQPYSIYPQNPLTFFETEKTLVINTTLPAEAASTQNTVLLLSSKAMGINAPPEPIILPYTLFNQNMTISGSELEQTLTQYQTSLTTLITYRFWLFPLIQFISSFLSLSLISLIYALPLTAAAMISRRPRRFKGWLSTTLITLSITQVLSTAFILIYGKENPQLSSLALTVLLLTALYLVKERPIIILKRQPEKSV